MSQRFEVWAPMAKTVAVVVADQAHAMERQEHGYWRAVVDGAGPGTRYAFSVDGGAARPDPRSAYQPEGVHGPSQVVDHAEFAWTEPGFRGVSLAGACLYELHIGTFTAAGTFDAAIERLPHLVELGVDAIELLPVAQFSGERGWGYDGVGLFAPHHAYGGPTGLKRLIDACHRLGLGVVMDVVYNHLGPEGNYLAGFGPYFSQQHHTHWGPAVNFDGPHSQPVRQFVIDNVRMWLRDYRCDGLRLDAVHALVDDSAVHILEEIASEVDTLRVQLRRPLWLSVECDLNDPKFIRPREAGGYGHDACWADEWHHALHAVLSGERSGYYADFGSLELLAKALRQGWVYDGTWSEHRQRPHGRPPTGVRGQQLVVFTQNHDQVGNRAQGDRLAAQLNPGRLKIAAALLLTGPFTPMLFQGQEWAASTPFQYFTNHGDPDLGRAVRDGRRREFSHFGWDPAQVPDPQAKETFVRSKLDWSELEEAGHLEILNFYQALLRLRRSIPALNDPQLDRVRVEHVHASGTLCVGRGPYLVAVNLGDQSFELQVPAGSQMLLASATDAKLAPPCLSLPPDSVAIVGPATQ